MCFPNIAPLGTFHILYSHRWLRATRGDGRSLDRALRHSGYGRKQIHCEGKTAPNPSFYKWRWNFKRDMVPKDLTTSCGQRASAYTYRCSWPFLVEAEAGETPKWSSEPLWRGKNHYTHRPFPLYIPPLSTHIN